MGSPRESEKALRYIEQLDDARCAGRWKDIPELTRKVAKHAPHRQCLILTARSEAQVAAYTTQRPSTTASTASTGLSKLIPELLTAIDDEGQHVQDAFQATVCLGWLHCELGEPGLAVARFPKDFAAVAAKMTNDQDVSNWTLVCLVKGTYLKGSSQERTAPIEEALQTYRSILPWLTSLKAMSTIPQFKVWSERLMVRLCLLADQSAEMGDLVDPEEALQIFRFWAKSWEYIGNSGSGGQGAARFRRLSWKAYYDTLSIILRHRLPYKPETSAIQSQDFAAREKGPLETRSSIRFAQRAELKRVETLYESILLKETDFPKASESNQEIEAWTESVIQNWRVLCGPTWTDGDLGEGGKEAVARGVLDILYRAATKTFHSTQILRHLFIVHASLAEFELAFKAYDTYVEIITRGKDRAEKSGEQDVGIDDDSTVLRTSAEAIRLLCRFGSAAQAEKALEIGEHIEKWLEQTMHMKSTPNEGSQASLKIGIAPKALAAAYSAVGISLAHWARFTYKAEARTSIQNKAVQYLRKSLEDQYEDSHKIETLYALGLLLAEMRDISGATKVVKVALSPATRHKSSFSADGVMSRGSPTEFGRERKLIPLWHLLSLLLTARAEYSAAEQSCENAFEQFGDPAVLFGQDDEGQPFRSEHLNQLSAEDGGLSGLVDHMEFYEKHGIVQMKMTQLALIEITEGSSTAVDLSDELLGLYHRLFGDPAHDKPKAQPPTTAVAPPKSSVGTIRHSIFRSKSTRRNQAQESTPRAGSVATVTTVASSRPSTVATHTTAAPTIHVTDEHGADRAEARGRFGHHRHEGHGPKRSGSKLQKRSSASLRRKSEMDAEKLPNMPGLPTNGTSTQASSGREKSPRRPSMSNSMRKSIENHDRPLRPVPHNMPNAPAPPGHARQPPKQDVRLPTAFPSAHYMAQDPRFSTIQEQRQKISLLVSIWIFIAGLYIGAKMFEDANAAVGEALKLVEAFELEVSQESSSSKAFADRGWGGGKSVEELWADTYAARGDILLAQELKHEARADFEQALQHFPDHPAAIVGLSNVLLDIYCKILPFEANQDTQQPGVSSRPPTPPSVPVVSDHSRLKAHDESKGHRKSHHTPSAENNISPPELTRIVARDRAFMLLSSLTKLGPGWDYSEAWYALARAYEESGQIEKTKEVLWWCVELEDSHPVRNWKIVGLGGFVL